MKKISPEIYFLRYARPCADFLRQRDEINDEQLKLIDDMLYEIIPPQKNFIEQIFHRAIVPLKEMSSNNYWNIDVLKEYFQKKHNELVDCGAEGFEHLMGFQKELCKVHEARIVKIMPDYYEVFYENKFDNVLKGFVKNANIDDIVFIHYKMVVEKK